MISRIEYAAELDAVNTRQLELMQVYKIENEYDRELIFGYLTEHHTATIKRLPKIIIKKIKSLKTLYDLRESLSWDTVSSSIDFNKFINPRDQVYIVKYILPNLTRAVLSNPTYKSLNDGTISIISIYLKLK